MNLIRRKEVPVKNNPGIYKRMVWDEKSQKWKESGRYRALRRTIHHGQSEKEQAVFDCLEDAKSFRMGKLDKVSHASMVHKNSIQNDNSRYTFEMLVRDWRAFHFLKEKLLSPSVPPIRDTQN